MTTQLSRSRLDVDGIVEEVRRRIAAQLTEEGEAVEETIENHLAPANLHILETIYRYLGRLEDVAMREAIAVTLEKVELSISGQPAPEAAPAEDLSPDR